jgi:hypothetical protein
MADTLTDLTLRPGRRDDRWVMWKLYVHPDQQVPQPPYPDDVWTRKDL